MHAGTILTSCTSSKQTWHKPCAGIMQKDDPAQRDYEAERHALFYTDDNARAYYKASNLISTDLFNITLLRMMHLHLRTCCCSRGPSSLHDEPEIGNASCEGAQCRHGYDSLWKFDTSSC